ncbi:MAG: hypothetical protein K5871_07150 [Lachnospiraceae bacterium]|nr:hypothetical protein [Lachnospiraceae bacterium]
MSNNNSDNIRRFTKSHNLSIGTVLFFLIFIYVIIVSFIYFSSDPIVRYEVVEGSLSSQNIYRAMAIRDEHVVESPYSGYVNFLAREGQKVAVGDIVYTVDETGRLNEFLESQSLLENTLTDKELDDFKNEIVDFAHSYDSLTYSEVYSFKYALQNSVLKLANSNFLESLRAAQDEGGLSTAVKYCTSAHAGTVSYWTDGYETLDPGAVTMDMFNERDYEKVNITANELRATGDPVYKLTESEDWCIVFPIKEADAEDFIERGYIQTRFLRNQYECWGKVSIIRNDKDVFCRLDFNNSMSAFANERFLDVELILGEETGLKVPNSSIIQKEFYLVDERFVIYDSVNNIYYIMITGYDETGQPITMRREISVYSHDEKNHVYYVDETIITAGDVLHLENSQDTFVISARGTLTGVYNINKGYADFKEITILAQNDEYAIVKPNSTYGLRVYDYIALKADTVSADQFINE